jgi:hypothetical protein
VRVNWQQRVRTEDKLVRVHRILKNQLGKCHHDSNFNHNFFADITKPPTGLIWVSGIVVNERIQKRIFVVHIQG